MHVGLESVISNLNKGKPNEAVRILAKIVENKLKEKVIKEESFKGKPMLHNLLNYAKKLRNKESHELDVQEETKNLSLNIFFGIDLLYKLK